MISVVLIPRSTLIPEMSTSELGLRHSHGTVLLHVVLSGSWISADSGQSVIVPNILLIPGLNSLLNCSISHAIQRSVCGVCYVLLLPAFKLHTVDRSSAWGF